MKGRLSVVTGLVVGIAVAGLLLGGILAFTPDRLQPPAAVPSLAISSPSPSPEASILPGVDVTP